MGMDVYGQDPQSDEGGYFRNNIWWWNPLAEYCQLVAPDEAAHCEHWHSNDCDGLDGEQSIALADKLQAEIDSGRCERYMLSRGTTGTTSNDDFEPSLGVLKAVVKAVDSEQASEDIETTPWPFSVENVKEFIAFLRVCGGFEIH